MAHCLVLGRDMNEDGTKIGSEVELLLKAAVAHQLYTGATLVVAPGFNPDFPMQPRSYAAMMADRLRELGAIGVVVLESEHFSSYGELTAFRQYCSEYEVSTYEVLGFSWHLKRVLVEARQVDQKWGKTLRPVPVPGTMKQFDLVIEPFKWAKLILPRSAQIRAIELWKRYVSKRTSY